MHHCNYAATGDMAKYFITIESNNIVRNNFNNYGACGDQGGNGEGGDIIPINPNGGNNVEHDANNDRPPPPNNEGQGNRGQ